MRVSTKLCLALGAGLFSLIGGAARADGLSDLRAALARLQGQAPLKAVLELKTWRRLGEGAEAEESQGQASLQLEDGARGMQVQYSKELLMHSEAEARAKGRDPKNKTPTLDALRELQANELRPMLAAAASLSRVLDEAQFKGETAGTYHGKPARLLSFEYAIDRLSERERKYVKKLDSKFELWIAADGTPLASRLRQSATGRAFVVVSFESRNEEDAVYQQVGERLLTVRKESRYGSSGAGERGEHKITRTLQVQA